MSSAYTPTESQPRRYSWQLFAIICAACVIGYWIGADHTQMQYEAQRRLDKALLSQPCIRPGALKQVIWDMKRRMK